ncbi:SRPBCC domain-containing protein [Flavobacterium sp. XGLA_31]|uniref:SRPBCC domain-containing protein n=1 Tax=Flavobacterium sp. XGLA_31 TaxID=3447666 RepID=UPI003F3000EE
MTPLENNTADREIVISRLLNAPVELVWEVWTNPNHIKNWWGPDGFTNTITKMEVAPEGEWDLVMHGPDGTDYKNKSLFKEVIKHRKLVYEHVSGPKFTATILFERQGHQTHLHWQMVFPTREELIQVVKTFNAAEGLKQNVAKLDAYLQVKFTLQQELKTTKKARVSTYLNFPGTTEAAFTFYKEVFNGTLLGKGFERFGDVPGPEDMPPLSEEDKKLILHVELEIMGGHVLVATDAPESLGFKLTHGDTMHIHLEPESRAETQRLFEALSKGGTITMPLEDMFFGAYYGSLTDQHGINWMLTYSEPKL